MRASVENGERSPEQLNRIKRRVEEQPGVRNVEINLATGSVVVQGDSEAQIRRALDTAVVLVGSVSDGEPSEQVVEAVVRAVQAADQKVRQGTGGAISLRWLVPATFVGLGVRQLIAQGFTIGSIPWYVLLYYGVDSFLKLHPEHAPVAPSRGDGRQEAPGPDQN